MKPEILIYNKTSQKIPEKFIENTISKILDFLKSKQPVELAVLVVSPAEIKKLNKTWRSKNYTPDELSFGLNSRQTVRLAKRKNNMLGLGEIVVNFDKIFNKNNLAEILVHGLLHLLGHHHEESAAEAKKTEKIERQILKHLNI